MKNSLETSKVERLQGQKRFKVALSFPGEKRDFVRQVAAALAAKLGGDRILYDEYLTAELARPNLDVHLGKLYHDESELLVPFFCADYERKEWCGLEFRQIRDLLKTRQEERIMPIRFDDAPISGMLSIDGFVKVGSRSPAEVAELILKRLDNANPSVPTAGIGGPTRWENFTYRLKSQSPLLAKGVFAAALAIVLGVAVSREVFKPALNTHGSSVTATNFSKDSIVVQGIGNNVSVFQDTNIPAALRQMTEVMSNLPDQVLTAVKKGQGAGTSTNSWQPPELPEGCTEVFYSLGGKNYSGQSMSRMTNANAFLDNVIFGGIGGMWNSPLEVRVRSNRFIVEAEVLRPAFPRGIGPIRVRGFEVSQLPPQWQKQQVSNALEIVNESLTPMCQIYYPSPDHVVVKGVFPYHGQTLVIGDEGMTFYPSNYSSEAALEVRKVKPIFKYPAWRYPGEYADK